MADNNSLVFYQQWAVAWLQMDKYSTNPWCVDSKNLDIFSDSQSAKGTAWSTPTAIPEVDWIDEDERGRFRLYEDGRVYDTEEQVWYNHDFYDDNAEKIEWRDKWISWIQEFWTPRKLFVKYDWDDWSEIVILTDNLKYYIPHDWLHFNMELSYKENYSSDYNVWDVNDYFYGRLWTSWTSWAFCVIPKMAWWRLKFTLGKPMNWTSFTNWSIADNQVKYLYRNSPTEALKWGWGWNETVLCTFEFDWTTNTYTLTSWSTNPDKWNVTINDNWELDIELFMSWYYAANMSWYNKWLRIVGTPSDNNWYIELTWIHIKEYWDYLVPSEKEVMQLDDKYYVEIDDNEYQELEWLKQYDIDATGYWTLMWSWVFTLPEWQEIIAITKTFDYRLVFVNKVDYDVGMVYLVPAWDDILTFSQGWEFPWIKFVNAIMVNWYSYVIAEERGIRWLYVFYNWQTKKIVWSNLKYSQSESLMDGKEIYDFTWQMINWRWHVVAPTKNWVYMYWENKRWQNVWSFILKVDWNITGLEVDNNNLKVIYTSWASSYYKIYQDDVISKNYESDWSITYPVQIWSHMFEKEVRDLEVSYSLPNSSTSMDVFVSVNDYYFWSFLTSWVVTAPDVWAKFKASWLSWNYWLEFVEKDWNWLTFKLTWDLPYQTANTKNLVSEDNQTTIAYTEFNHFKKIGTCSKTDPFMKEGKARIFKIATDNELPIVRKMQIRVDWHTDTHNSPLLYSIRLLSEQKDR